MSNVANRGQNVPARSTPTDMIGPRSRSRLSARYVLVVLKWRKNRSIFKARWVFSFAVVQSDPILCWPTDEHNRKVFACELTHSRLATIIVNQRVRDVWKSTRRVNRLKISLSLEPWPLAFSSLCGRLRQSKTFPTRGESFCRPFGSQVTMLLSYSQAFGQFYRDKWKFTYIGMFTRTDREPGHAFVEWTWRRALHCW